MQFRIIQYVFLLHKCETLSYYVVTLFMLITIKIVVNC